MKYAQWRTLNIKYNTTDAEVILLYLFVKCNFSVYSILQIKFKIAVYLVM